MWHLFIWNSQARPMEEVLSCQSQDNLSVSEANIEVSSFSCWSPSSLISPLCNKDTIWKCPPIQHCEWVCTIHVEGEHQATCFHPPAPLPRLTPQPTSREARHISEHKRSVSVTWRSGVHGLLGPHIKTEGDWEAFEAEEPSTEF